MFLDELIWLNQYDNDKIMLVDSNTKDVIIESTCNNFNLQQYYGKEVKYIGVSNDMGTNLLVFIDL